MLRASSATHENLLLAGAIRAGRGLNDAWAKCLTPSRLYAWAEKEQMRAERLGLPVVLGAGCCYIDGFSLQADE